MTAVRWTEKTVLDAIEPRYRKPGNGGSGEYAFLRQVRNAAGFDASRTFDAVAIHLWPSRGFITDVIEVKVSRSDWLRELKEPAKAEAAHTLADRFIVAAPTGIVRSGELPPGWGLLEVSEKRTRMTVTPDRISTSKRTAFPAGFVIALLRAAGAASTATPDDALVNSRVAEIRAALKKDYDAMLQGVVERERERADRALRFADVAGLPGYGEPEEYGRKVKAALAADRNRDALVAVLNNQRERLDRMITDLQAAS